MNESGLFKTSINDTVRFATLAAGHAEGIGSELQMHPASRRRTLSVKLQVARGSNEATWKQHTTTLQTLQILQAGGSGFTSSVLSPPRHGNEERPLEG